MIDISSHFLKRLSGLFLGLLGLIVFSPVILFIAASIFFDDGFPIIFQQVRFGEKKSPIIVYKFRSLRDGKITKVGQWLRSTGLDELLQFINIVKGEMNIVGPRPLTEEDIHRLGWASDAYRKRWSVKPGITGLAQLYAGQSAKLSWQMDQIYLAHPSFYQDIKIILISLTMNLLGKKNVRKLFNLQPPTKKENYL